MNRDGLKWAAGYLGLPGFPLVPTNLLFDCCHLELGEGGF